MLRCLFGAWPPKVWDHLLIFSMSGEKRPYSKQNKGAQKMWQSIGSEKCKSVSRGARIEIHRNPLKLLHAGEKATKARTKSLNSIFPINQLFRALNSDRASAKDLERWKEKISSEDYLPRFLCCSKTRFFRTHSIPKSSLLPIRVWFWSKAKSKKIWAKRLEDVEGIELPLTFPPLSMM